MKWVKHNRAGFTIVELLIVIVVIAILATITIVSYNGITARAYVSGVQSDFRNAIQSLELYKVDVGNFPAHDTNVQLAAAKIYIDKDNYNQVTNNFVYCVNNSTGRVAIAAVGKNGVTYAQSNYRSFGVYTDYTVTNYAGVCTDLVGANNARYGFASTENPKWRVWVNP